MEYVTKDTAHTTRQVSKIGKTRTCVKTHVFAGTRGQKRKPSAIAAQKRLQEVRYLRKSAGRSSAPKVSVPVSAQKGHCPVRDASSHRRSASSTVCPHARQPMTRIGVSNDSAAQRRRGAPTAAAAGWAASTVRGSLRYASRLWFQYEQDA